TPQMALTVVLGFNSPTVVSMPSTNVPESAEVMKKEEIKSTATPTTTDANGCDSRNANNATSFPISFMSWWITPPSAVSISNPAIPKIENQMALNNTGTAVTPMTNSRMVLPLETRAIKVPTNGDQPIHQAQ